MGNTTSCNLLCSENNATIMKTISGWKLKSVDIKTKKELNNYLIDNDKIIIEEDSKNGSIIFFDKKDVDREDGVEDNKEDLSISYAFNTNNKEDCLIYITLIDRDKSIEDIINNMKLSNDEISIVHIFLKNKTGYIGIRWY